VRLIETAIFFNQVEVIKNVQTSEKFEFNGVGGTISGQFLRRRFPVIYCPRLVTILPQTQDKHSQSNLKTTSKQKPRLIRTRQMLPPLISTLSVYLLEDFLRGPPDNRNSLGVVHTAVSKKWNFYHDGNSTD
jgi:hypothetical protein